MVIVKEVIRKVGKSLIIGVLSCSVLSLGIFGLGVSEAWAEKSVLSMSPMSQKVLLTPGEVYEGSLQITNASQATGDLDYIVSVGSYTVKQGKNNKDDYGDYDIETRTAQNMIVDWITVVNPEGAIAPGKSATVSFLINVPETATAGMQYATLLVKSGNGNTEGETGGIKEVMQMAHIIYATVAGETIETGEILENNIPAFILDGNLTTSVMVENSGNVYTDAEYILQVWPNGSEEEICTNEENADEKIVLPGTKRHYEGGCTLPAPGVYQVKQTVRIFGEESVVEGIVVYCPIWVILANLLGSTLIVVWAAMAITGKGRTMKKMMRK